MVLKYVTESLFTRNCTHIRNKSVYKRYSETFPPLTLQLPVNADDKRSVIKYAVTGMIKRSGHVLFFSPEKKPCTATGTITETKSFRRSSFETRKVLWKQGIKISGTPARSAMVVKYMYFS
ncbi:MAG: hypothetical protein RDV48_08360 [Candidatus Eremiobacteraeota bacterium]|nr:hypothetical protein [Candidatus Eremiobacteraeota bacterium]